MKLILASPPELEKEAAGTGLPPARMRWRISGGGLHAAPGERGGIMAVDARELGEKDNPERLCRVLEGERRRGGFGGILFDAGERTRETGRLAACLEGNGCPVYLTERAAEGTKRGIALTETAISGGTLERHLRETLERFGPGRVALDIERVRMEFILPERSGKGRNLTAQELSDLLARFRPRVFFSGELCANYFTWRDGKGTRFVLFDTAGTIRRKLELSEKLGIGEAFLFYPEVKDILGELRGI